MKAILTHRVMDEGRECGESHVRSLAWPRRGEARDTRHARVNGSSKSGPSPCGGATFFCRFIFCLLGCCRRFETGGSLGRRVKMSPRAPAQMGRRETEREGGGKRQPEREREVEIPRPSCLSRTQVGCACSRGLQASTRERERVASRERLSRPLPRAAHPL